MDGEKTIIRIWTECYRPFLLCGNVNQPIAAQIEAHGPYDLGQGFEGYLVIAPFGKTFVVEKESGGIVGASLDVVREDIVACPDAALMKGQIENAKKRGRTAQEMDAKQFWNLFMRKEQPTR